MLFKSIVLLPLKPPSAVITILHWESLIRAASAEEENPAKITECMAPILAHARILIASSGIIGRYTATRSPFLIPTDNSAFAILQTL